MKKILIANRGEIALRIIRACKEMGIETVAIYSTADKDAMHVKLADESVCVGPARSSESYLNKQAIISAAVVTHADGVHPGYGFLSENADFAEMIEDHGFTFIGPKSQHLRIMGDKITAKQTALNLGIPTVPGSDGIVGSLQEAHKIADSFGYPIIIKASAGGGGKGMKPVFSKSELNEAFSLAKHEALAAFGNDSVYIEKFLQNPRHIEVQLLGDKHGNMMHLYERDCSIQRRNQKVIEECLSSILTSEQREYICNLSAQAMKKLGYYGAGTIEYLYEDGNFYFMEMNTRLQVEHPITELVTNVDIIYEMIRIAQNKEISFKQEDINPTGHAIECRINAEDPYTFVPSPGKITYFHSPGGLGVRMETAIYTDYSIPPYYDSMIGKLIVKGNNREHAIQRLKLMLDEIIISGIKTNIPLHQKIINSQDFIDNNYSIKWLEKFLDEQK